MAADYSHLLPPPVLDRILETAFHTTDADSDRFPPPVQLTTLASLGKAINASVRRILAREVVLQDDDNRLVDAEEGQSAVLLARVVNDPNWANDVKLLTVVNPVFDQASDPALCHPPPPPPLDDAAFFLCLSRFETLSSFTWHSHRIPPELLCLALGQAAKNLTNFKLELVPLPLSGGTTTTDAAAPPSSPLLQQHQSPTSASGLYSPLLHGSGVGNGTATSAAASAPAPRWDAPHLASLPAKLTHLSLSNLSSLGAQSLAEHALPALPMLEFVQLEKTLWVDDHVLEAMGRHLKGLGVLKVREMAGTKLSENGLGEVLRGCPELRELHLDCVQGAFTSNDSLSLLYHPTLTRLLAHNDDDDDARKIRPLLPRVLAKVDPLALKPARPPPLVLGTRASQILAPRPPRLALSPRRRFEFGTRTPRVDEDRCGGWEGQGPRPGIASPCAVSDRSGSRSALVDSGREGPRCPCRSWRRRE